MEPISLIAGALVLGAAAAAKEVGGSALKDAYAGLKRMIVDRYAAVQPVVTLVEDNPEGAEAYEQAAAATLATTDAAHDQELIDQAEALLAALKEANAIDEARYNIIVSGSGAAAVGGGVAAGEGGTAIGGDYHGDLSPRRKKDDEA